MYPLKPFSQNLRPDEFLSQNLLNYRNFCTNEDFYRKIFQCVKSIRSSFERILSDELSGQRLYYVLDLFLPKSDLFQILTGSPHAFHRMRHVDLAQIGGDERALGRTLMKALRLSSVSAS